MSPWIISIGLVAVLAIVITVNQTAESQQKFAEHVATNEAESQTSKTPAPASTVNIPGGTVTITNDGSGVSVEVEKESSDGSGSTRQRVHIENKTSGNASVRSETRIHTNTD